MAAKVRRDSKGVYWVVVHYKGRRKKKRVGRDQRVAEQIAKQIQAKLVLGEFDADEPKESEVPFAAFAQDWLWREVELPIERNLRDRLAAGTARVNRLQVDVHLTPYFGQSDLRSISLREVQGFYDHCLDSGRPRSATSVAMALSVLRLVLSHAKGQGIVGVNAVEQWKAGRPRRRSSSTLRVTPDNVLAADELAGVLEIAEVSYQRHFPFVLFLADTGTRFGEAAALRWSDVDLAAGTARIARSFSSGVKLGPTKTGRTRVVELSQRLCGVLAQVEPNIFPIPEEALVFPSESGTFLQGTNFRSRVFSKIIVKALGKGRHYTPHCLRHTWASLHLARGTPIKWVQQQGGWTTAKVLLDTYGHYMPDEMRGYSDALTATPNGPPAAPTRNSDSEPDVSQSESPDFSWVSEAVDGTIIPRSPNRSIGTQRPNPEDGAAWPISNPC